MRPPHAQDTYIEIELTEPSLHDVEASPNECPCGNGWYAWMETSWPLFCHLAMSLSITLLMVYYVDGNYFNLNDRRPWVSIAGVDGGKIRWDEYAPLQSDITTILSTILVLFRLIFGVWITSLAWRSIFLLMNAKGGGLRSRSLKQIIQYGLLYPKSLRVQNWHALLVGATLFINIMALSAAPILTGSISWVPSNTPARHLTNATIKVPVAFHSEEWDRYQSYVEWRKRVTVQAAGLVAAAWRPSDQKGILKRALRSTTGLNTNSTISNVTLPYFSVTSLEWLSDPKKELSPYQQDVDGFWHYLGVGDGKTSLTVPGTVGFILDPNTAWRNTPFPSPSIVSETRMLVLYASRLVGTADPTCRLDNSNISSSLPPGIGLLFQREFCYAFARVSFEAGASVCTQCRLSSPITVQNDTKMTLGMDPMTNEALWMTPDVINHLVLSNTSIPSSWGSDSLDDYVSELLARSYCGAWNGLNQWFGGPGAPLKSEFAITLPAIKARVNLSRVYTWFGIQCLATFLGGLFLVVLAKSTHPLLGDTSMVPFYLNAIEVPTRIVKGVLWVIPTGDRWKVTVSR